MDDDGWFDKSHYEFKHESSSMAKISIRSKDDRNSKSYETRSRRINFVEYSDRVAAWRHLVEYR